MNKQDINNEEPIKEFKETNVYTIMFIVFTVFFIILFLMFLGISILNSKSETIASGIYIKNINVSGLEKQEAVQLVNKELSKYMNDSIILKHNDYSTEISLEQLDASFDVEAAVNAAYEYGRKGNVFVDSFQILSVMVSNISIDPILNINEDELKNKLNNISSQLPDTIVQSAYYIEDNNLIITKGKEGYSIDTDKMFEKLKNEIQTLNFINQEYKLEVIKKDPEPIDIDKIHSQICKMPVNATYTVNPYSVSPSEDGVDFNISIEEAKNVIKNSEQEEYIIPLKIVKPEITTNMIGAEAFPDLISNFSTKYNPRQVDRTTNLKLASEKINGTVIMPGEIFSYNTVVGKRTIDAGYKEAKIYVSGQVVDGLGGGICQVSTTLYNAALYANLEIVERRNHQFVPSYAGAGLDATVVYGAIDFKIKNTRNYPIKIVCWVDKGICNFELYGLKEQTEYEVVLNANVISRSSTSIKSKTYRTLKLNGQEIKTELLSTDTYKTH